jgi:hypothetical protein
MDKRKKDKRINSNLQNNTQRTKDWATRTPLKTESEIRCSGRARSSSSTSGTRHVTLVTNPLINHEWGKDLIVITTMEHLRGHLWHRYSATVNQVMVVTVNYNKSTITQQLINKKQFQSGWDQNIIKDFFFRNRTHWFDLIWFIVFNATFSNISAISWRPVLVVEEAGVLQNTLRE